MDFIKNRIFRIALASVCVLIAIFQIILIIFVRPAFSGGIWFVFVAAFLGLAAYIVYMIIRDDKAEKARKKEEEELLAMYAAKAKKRKKK